MTDAAWPARLVPTATTRSGTDRDATERGAAGSGPTERGPTERGTAVVGTLVGFLIFMVLLLFGVQTLVHLYATSALTAAANEAAQAVATDGGAPSGVPGAQAEARASLGGFGGAHTRFDWIEVDARQVVLRVTATSPGLLPLSASLDRISRTVTWRTERFG